MEIGSLGFVWRKEMLRGMVSPQNGSGLFDSKLETYNISLSHYQYVAFSGNFVF
jgi:hypothetical protein